MSNLREATKRAVWQLRHGELDTEMCLHIADFLDAALASPQNDDTNEVIIEDLREMLRALGMFDGAQPKSPHEVFQAAIAEMKRRLTAQPQNDAEAAEIIAGLRHAASNRSNRLQQVHEIDKAIAFLSAPPSSRMRRALEKIQDLADGLRSCVIIDEIRKELNEALRAGDNHETPPSPERMREVLETIISALDRATGDTDAPYVETDDDYRDQYPVHWAMQKLNALLQSLRAGDNHASDGKESEGGVEGHARTGDGPAVSPSGDVTPAGHSHLAGDGQERNRVRKEAGIKPGPSEHIPSDDLGAPLEREETCEACFGTGRFQGKLGGPDWPSCPNCSGKFRFNLIKRPSDDLERIRTEAARLGYALVPNDREDDPLSARDLTMMDQAWENHKAALPVATVINDNQPGRTAIIEITIDPPTLGLGTKLYASPKILRTGITSFSPTPAAARSTGRIGE